MLRSIDTSSCDSTAASTTAFKENSVIRYAEFSDLSADDDDDADEEEEEYDDGDSTFAPGRSTTSSAASKRGKKRKKTGNSKSNKAIKAAGKNQARKGVAKGSVEGVDQGGGNVNKPPRSIAMVGRRGRIATKAAFATNINMTPPQQQQQQQRLLPDSPSIATSRQQPNNLVGQYPWIMAHQLALLQQHHLKQFQLMHDFVAAQHRNQRYRQTISSSSSSSRCSTHHHPLLNNIRTKPSSPSLLEKIHHHHSATARLELKYLFACFDYDGRELEDGVKIS